ncbi:MAG TPA: helix-turn-helix domain-containing protein [Gracilimonas sp.]|nr:helix-turn-helix domain-containing protein [Gracilimonas sp.]
MSKIEKALKILEENISMIFSVSEWAEAVGYKNTKNFYRHFRKHYHETPKSIIIEYKLMHIKKIMQKYPNEKFLFIAWEANFNDDHHLRQFVYTHTKKSLTDFHKTTIS